MPSDSLSERSSINLPSGVTKLYFLAIAPSKASKNIIKIKSHIEAFQEILYTKGNIKLSNTELPEMVVGHILGKGSLENILLSIPLAMGLKSILS